MKYQNTNSAPVLGILGVSLAFGLAITGLEDTFASPTISGLLKKTEKVEVKPVQTRLPVYSNYIPGKPKPRTQDETDFTYAIITGRDEFVKKWQDLFAYDL